MVNWRNSLLWWEVWILGRGCEKTKHPQQWGVLGCIFWKKSFVFVVYIDLCTLCNKIVLIYIILPTNWSHIWRSNDKSPGGQWPNYVHLQVILIQSDVFFSFKSTMTTDLDPRTQNNFCIFWLYWWTNTNSFDF